MDISRINYLRRELQERRISQDELNEIEEAFDKIPDDELPDLRANALADDMLDELEEQVSPMEKCIYDWVLENFGESEAIDPSWSISSLADYINKDSLRYLNPES